MLEIVKLINLAATLSPVVLQAVIRLTESMQGKTLEEIQGESDTIFDAVIARAKAEIAAAEPPVNP